MRGARVDVKSIKNVQYVKQLDYLLLFAVLALSIIGAIAVRSALNAGINSEDAAVAAAAQSTFIKHISFLAVGFILSLVLARFDYGDYKILGFILFIISTLLLMYVKVNGVVVFGAKSWVKLPVIGIFQPSEIAKITFIMVCAVFLTRLKDEEEHKLQNMIKLIVYAAIPIGLILLQPDMGTVLVFIFILAVMLFAYGIKMRFFLIPVGLSIPIAILSWFFFLDDYQKNRILVFLDPFSIDPKGMGEAFQISRSITAIGSGQLYGKGLFEGYSTQQGLVPVKDSDFILTVIGEEFGFIGSVLVVLLFLFIILRCLKIARKARDSYGSIMIAGIVGMFGFHFIENFGMCIGLMPITGIPLPFVSYGSSAMLTNFIAIGIVQSVVLRSKPTMFGGRKQ